MNRDEKHRVLAYLWAAAWVDLCHVARFHELLDGIKPMAEMSDEEMDENLAGYDAETIANAHAEVNY